ncbi:Zinc finger, PHD-type [Corchorus olitorius]|uniref:Zinc finger, PHD-type n=1 Tax=Corchorus olitorius TaxID=93759 RepID=A0A1R3JMK9_9ROSI|nr:Zinc finger, PHD-type [Corchorus olitorius]
MQIKLASHEHSMPYYYFQENDDKWCGKCRAKISGAAYACQKCEHWLHESCAKALENLPREITHPLHSIPKHHLTLDWSGITREFICDICLKVSSGTNYVCCRCTFEVDLTCAFVNFNEQAMTKTKKKMPNSDKDKLQIIQHYCHRDPMILFEHSSINVQEHDFKCSWCEKDLTGNFYGCKGCEFFLHESCIDKIPKMLNHPFHPSHPLRLQFVDGITNCNACKKDIRLRAYSTLGYCCKECNFNLDFFCAKLFPTLKHKCHDHYLTYFGPSYFNDKILKFNFKCNSCHELCFDSFYRCVQCDLNLHLKCVPIPPLVKHRYHRHPLVFTKSVWEDDFGEYYCDICEEERDPTHQVFYCEKCTFIAHIECVLNEVSISSTSVSESMDRKALMVKEMEQIETIDHQQPQVRPLIHQHPLKFCEETEDLEIEDKYCVACCLPLSGPGYICEECPSYIHGYCLHEKCYQLPNQIQNPLHSQHHLNLFFRPPRTDFFLCDECGDISAGFIYLCEECDFKLDVKCATAKKAAAKSRIVLTLEEAARETELFHFSHKHNWILHESCVKLPQEMRVQLHDPQHISILSYAGYGFCDACGLKLLSFSFCYNCQECDFCFHITCANSPRRVLKVKSHQHHLYYFGAEFQHFFATYCDIVDVFAGKHCCHCGENCSVQAFYRCLECDVNFHLECVPIPQIVKSKVHVHPLTLKDSFIEDDSGEYYCDACEEERCPNDHVYCCEECQYLFVAHIECVLGKEEEVVTYLVPRERKKRMRRPYQLTARR